MFALVMSEDSLRLVPRRSMRILVYDGDRDGGDYGDRDGDGYHGRLLLV